MNWVQSIGRSMFGGAIDIYKDERARRAEPPLTPKEKALARAIAGFVISSHRSR